MREILREEQLKTTVGAMKTLDDSKISEKYIVENKVFESLAYEFLTFMPQVLYIITQYLRSWEFASEHKPK